MAFPLDAKRSKLHGQTGQDTMQALEEADRLMLFTVAQRTGDAATSVLLGILMGATERLSGERTLMERLKVLLQAHISAATNGQFLPEPYPADYPAQALDEYQSEPHRLVWLVEQLQQYLNPPGKVVREYVKDKNQGTLVLYQPPTSSAASSSSSATALADAARTLERGLVNAQREYELLKGSMPQQLVMPQAVRPSAQQLQLAATAEAEALADLRAFQDQHKQVAGISAAAASTASSASQDGAAKEEVKPSIGRLPADIRAELQRLVDEQAAAARYVQELTGLDQQWQQYTNTAHAAYEQRLAAAELRVSNLAQSLHAMRVTPSAMVKPPTVPGFLLEKEGIIVTPSMAVYYIVRLTLEAVYQLGGKLSEAQYRGLTRGPRQSLHSWGGTILAMAQTFPKLSDEIHRGVYLRGIQDAELIASLDNMRMQTKVPWDLKQLVSEAQQLAEREAGLLQERIDGPTGEAGNDKGRQESQRRLLALQKLLGLVRTAAEPPPLPKPRPTPTDPKPRPVLPQLHNARAYTSYANAPCVRHPKALKPHTNGECSMQRQQLGEVARGLVAVAETAMLAAPRQQLQPPPSTYSSSSSMPPQAYIDWGGYGPAPSAYTPSIYPPSTATPSQYPTSEYGLAATTVRLQRQQANQQHQANRQQHPPGLQREAPLRAGPAAPQAAQRPGGTATTVGGLDLPPPPQGHGSCEHCGWQTNHYPYPCGYRYPWLASPMFNAPGERHATHLQRMFEENRSRMPPGMQLGGMLPEWYDRYRDQFNRFTCSRIERDMQQGRQSHHAAMGVFQPPSEYAYMAGYGNLDPAVAAYDKARRDLGLQEPMFINQPPVVFQVAAAPSSSSGLDAASAAAATASAYEYAAAYPRSFLQTKDSSQPVAAPAAASAAAPAAATAVVPAVSAAAPAAAPVAAPAAAPVTTTPADFTEADGIMYMRLHRTAFKMRRVLREAEQVLATFKNVMPSSRAPEHAAAVQSSKAVPAASPAADSLLPLAASLPLLTQQLQQVMVQHGVTPGDTDPTGLYRIQLGNREGRRYQLDTFTNASPAEGIVLVLLNGAVVQPHAIVDSGCSSCLSDKDFMHQHGWRYRHADVRLILANGTTAKVVGIAEPAWMIVAAGTPDEAKVMVQPLVVEGVRPTFSFAVSKDILHKLNAYVIPAQQEFSYLAAAGHRASVPVSSYQPISAESASSCSIERDFICNLTATAMVAVAAELPQQVNTQPQLLATSAAADAEPQASTESAAARATAPAAAPVPAATASSSDTVYTAVAGPTAMLLQDRWAPNAPCRLHRGDHTNSQCRLQSGQQQGCDEALYAAAFNAAGSLAGPDERFTTYSSAFPAIRRDALSSSASSLVGSAAVTTSPAAFFAATADPTTSSAGTLQQQSSQPALSSEPTAGSVLADIGYTAPHLYFRGVSYLGRVLTTILWVSLLLFIGCIDSFIPVSAMGAWAMQCLPAAAAWWQNLLLPVPLYQEPDSPRAHIKHRKRSYAAWATDLLDRAARGKPLTASIRRHYRRFITTFQDHQAKQHRHNAAQFATGISLRALCPLLLLLLVCCIAQAVATPALIQGVQCLTGNLAAWEFSHLARGRFSEAGLYNDISSRPASRVQQQQWQQLLNPCAAAADSTSVPSYPGAVDPLQLDELLPDGPQHRPAADTYTVDEEHKWSYGNHPGMTEEQLQRLKEMLIRTKKAFAYSLNELPGYNGPPVDVQLVHDRPIISKPRNYSQLEIAILNEKCEELRAAGFIVPADPFSFAIDYRAVNAATVTLRYALELPERLFQRVAGRPYLTSIDARAAFAQLPLTPAAAATTSFFWGKSLWMHVRLPYGNKNSVYEFQRVVDKVLGDAGLSECAWAYVDDILIASATAEDHIRDVEAVLLALHAAGLRVHPGKSIFCSDRMDYLGHVITPTGLEPQAAKVAAMASLPAPTSVPVLQSFLGLLNYYRHFIPGFSATAKPLNQLLQKGVPFTWGPDQQQAFDALKQQLCTEGAALRRPDPTKQYILHTDWSQHGMGAVLAQLDDDGNEYMVACASRSLNVHERNYTPWKGELLAVVWGIKTFRVYLHGVHFELCTDHKPLLWLLNQPEPTGQHARWVLSLMEYDFHVRHRPGVEHVNADVLSRYPHLGCEDSTGAQLDSSSDPVQAPLPKLVFGPLGTGIPEAVPLDQIPTEQPPQSKPQPRVQPQQPQASTSAPAAGPSRPSRQTKAAYRKKHQSPYAATATAEYAAFAAPIYTMALAVSAAQSKAAFVQRHLSTAAHAAVDEYTLQQWDPWELPYSALPDPLASVTVEPLAAEQQQQLRQRATAWVQAAVAQPQQAPTTQPLHRSPASLNITSVAATFFPAAQAGLVVYEPFGGLCSGLDMVLRNGFSVSAYFYSDIDPAARAVAAHRLQLLQARYPGLLPATALAHTFTALPQDVWQITPQHLQQLTAAYQRQWLVVGGWECQDLSPAGSSQGLHGAKSSTLAPLISILAALQQCQHPLPPAYIVENTAMQYNFRSAEVRGPQFDIICAALGEPICLDATQFDSLAHRVRNYWTNLCQLQQLQAAAAHVKRTPGLTVDTAMDPASGRVPALVTSSETSWSGRYPANQVGKPRSAWPTFVAYPMSRAFKSGEPGSVWDPREGYTEPNAEEREQAMGYRVGDTAAPATTEQQRRGVLGRCIDANVLESIFAIAVSWYRHQHWVDGGSETLAAALTSPEQLLEQLSPVFSASATISCSPPAAIGAEVAGPQLEQYLVGIAVATVAEAQERDSQDIWLDCEALFYLREQQYKPEWTQGQRDRVRKRAAKYSCSGDGTIRRKFPDGSTKLVPKPAERRNLILQFHHRTGHYGVRRTGALISNSYWWWGLWSEVAAELSKCSLCARVRSSFNSEQPELQPLPISGLMYRWGVDLCGPFPTTDRGNQFVMVAVEHYSKHLELVPIPNKEPATTAAAFAAAVLGRYGSPAEVLTDRGGEWYKEFERLLLDCMIDHRRTSASHPAANGLSERCVATTKRALSKLCAEQGSQLTWDLQLPWIMLGYNASPQKSTGLSPYQLMHAVTPTVPPAVRERIDQPIDFEDPEAAAADFLARARLVQERSVMAGENLKVAQHRDTLRYAKLRSGNYTPQLRRYLPGDYVYVKRKDKEGLDILARPLILRVHEVRATGVLILQGRCGTYRAVHSGQCAPCHLPNIDPTVDWSLGKPPAAAVCERCNTDDSEERGQLIFCDNCNSGWHLGCHQPALTQRPRGTWVCQPCQDQGISLEAVRALQFAYDVQSVQQLQPEKLSPAELRAKALDGRLLQRLFTKPGQQRQTQWYWGQVTYRGRGVGGDLLVVYEDGDAEVTTSRKLSNAKVRWLPEGTVTPTGVHFKPASEALAEIAARVPTPAAARAQPAVQLPAPALQPPVQLPAPALQPPVHLPAPAQQQGQLRRSLRRPAARVAAVAATQQLHAAAASQLPSLTLAAAASSDVAGVIPAGTPVALTTRHICLVTSHQQQPILPRYWDLSSPADLQSAMQALMPGPLAPKDVTRISNAVAQMQQECNRPQPKPGRGFVPMHQSEVLPLLSSLDFSSCSSFYDPFAGTGTISTAFQQAGYTVRSNDLNPYWGHATRADALQPNSYLLPYQIIVTSPPFELLDVAVPLLAAKAAVAACVHVPGHWISNPRAARQQWLQQLAAQNRLHIILGLPRGPCHRRCAWVVVFSSAAKRSALLLDSTTPLPFTYAGIYDITGNYLPVDMSVGSYGFLHPGYRRYRDIGNLVQWRRDRGGEAAMDAVGASVFYQEPLDWAEVDAATALVGDLSPSALQLPYLPPPLVCHEWANNILGELPTHLLLPDQLGFYTAVVRGIAFGAGFQVGMRYAEQLHAQRQAQMLAQIDESLSHRRSRSRSRSRHNRSSRSHSRRE